MYKYNILTYPLQYFTALLWDEVYLQDHLDLDYLQPFICNFSSRPQDNNQMSFDSFYLFVMCMPLKICWQKQPT